MKKVLCVLLALVVLLGNMALAEMATDEDAINFEPTLTTLMDYSASEWYDSVANRATLTILLMIDLKLSDESFAQNVQLLETSYVGKSGLDLVVYVHGEEEDIIMLYRPLTEEAYYISIGSVWSDTLAEVLMNSVCDDEYHENDIEVLIEVFEQFEEAFASD